METIIILILPLVINSANAAFPNSNSCGVDNADRIYPGNITGITSYPWASNLIFHESGRNEDLFRCGGSLISDRYVLTAAHCFDSLGDGYELQRIRFGEWDVQNELDCDYHGYCNEPILEVGFEKIVAHKDYNERTLINDIALIKLNESIEFTEAISPVCLPLSKELENLEVGNKKFTIVGWKNIRHRNGTYEPTSPIKLHDWMLEEVDAETCSNLVGEPISASQICALGKDTCRGDSGSGLIRKVNGFYSVNGIVSVGCGGKNVPAVYTKVDMFLDWIRDNIVD
ncbi:CLIP domain-containing serine protease B4 isoform X1 [Aedes albopictus]|uniref:Peptidase S1 domain-containing protein n=1 Tax=Aedes albopictus TaxID=7160 RepID=A0ABM1Y1R3_AEDAL